MSKQEQKLCLERLRSFPVFDRERPVPLAVGIFDQIMALSSDDPLISDKKMLSQVLKDWTASHSYWIALAAGGPRYDLHMNPVEDVTLSQQRYAAYRYLFALERLKKKAKADDRVVVPEIPEAVVPFLAHFQITLKKTKLTKEERQARHDALVREQQAAKAKRKAEKRAKQAELKAKKKKSAPLNRSQIQSHQPDSEHVKSSVTQPVGQRHKKRDKKIVNVVVKKRRRIAVTH